MHEELGRVLQKIAPLTIRRRCDPGPGLKGAGKMALVEKSTLKGDLTNRRLFLQQLLGTRNPARRDVGMRCRAGFLTESPQKMEAA